MIMNKTKRTKEKDFQIRRKKIVDRFHILAILEKISQQILSGALRLINSVNSVLKKKNKKHFRGAQSLKNIRFMYNVTIDIFIGIVFLQSVKIVIY